MARPDNDLDGKLVLITGASGGIGSACAREFADRGCHLALTYSSSPESAHRLASELQQAQDETKQSRRITTHKADMGIPDEVVRLCEEVQKEHDQSVDILIPNAGYGKRIRDVSDIPLDEFEYTLNVNLRAPFLLVKGVVNGMKAKKWGRIIFVSSIAAYGGGINGCHYAASKGGLMAMMKNLATTLAPYNISVNDVAPAMIGNTGMIPDGNVVPGLLDSIPLKRLGEPDEIARAVVMYARSGYITGQSLVMSGGLPHH